MIGNFRKASLEDFLVETLHIFCLEGRFERDHFVDHATKRPDITFDVIRLIFPDFRRGVVWGTCLSIVESLRVGYF
jgi:hypothetical protein